MATRLQRIHEAKFDICLELEQLADALPGNVDRFRCLRIASELVPLLQRSHSYEEQAVFPDLAASAELHMAVDRLKGEHLEDLSAAEEVTDVLLAIGHGHVVQNAEAIGFMLRSFFTSLRRHVDSESQLVSMAEASRSVAEEATSLPASGGPVH